MADVQAGIGPFLGVFLQRKGWGTGAIGSVMTLGGIAGMLATGPAGALVDATRSKRALVVIGSIFTVLASALLWISPSYAVVAASQIATAVAGAALGPALAGITLGMVRQAGFDPQFGRNQVANHAGNVVCASLSGYLGWKFGYAAVFFLAGLFAVLAIVSVLLIPQKSINHRYARGLENDDDAGEQPSGLRVLFANRPLLILAGALAFSISATRRCCRCTDWRWSPYIRAIQPSLRPKPLWWRSWSLCSPRSWRFASCEHAVTGG
jgi:predicted MFS family arabinose efflux permease